MSNIIKLTDSYKLSHWNTYPKGTEKIHSYMSSRGGEYDEMVFHGLAYYLKKYLSKPVSLDDVYEAKALAKDHGVPFNWEGWTYIWETYGGNLPIIIKALPEGSIFKPHDVILTIENTDPKCAWLTSYLETLICAAVGGLQRGACAARHRLHR